MQTTPVPTPTPRRNPADDQAIRENREDEYRTGLDDVPTEREERARERRLRFAAGLGACSYFL